MTIPARVAERAATRYVEDVDGCWISTYSLGSHGYAQVGWWDSGRSRMTTAHRAAWAHHYGQAPDELQVDHVCHVRRCVNPTRLRLLPSAQNSQDNLSHLRATNLPAGKKCKRGHDMVIGVTQNYCRVCKNEARRKRKAA